jgi:ubiquinone/menaquinone biosynthesis C-methylase UbiE
MLDRARAKLPSVRFEAGDLASPLPFPDRRFDKICCAQTLKHLPDLRPTLREFSRTLQPGGWLVFSVTHPDMVWNGYEMSVAPGFILSQEADIHHHTWATYQDALDAAGFRAVVRKDVRVSEVIASLLTVESFAKVVGRPQVLVCSARVPA